MTQIAYHKALKQKNQLSLQQINEQLKSLEDQKMSLIKSIFKYSTDSSIQINKTKSIEMEEDLKNSEVSTTIPTEDKAFADQLAKESHLYQKMASLLSKNGCLHALSIICQEELGNLDKMLNFPLELKVLNGINKLETLQSLKKQKRKSKKNNANTIQKKSRRIKKEKTGIRNIMGEIEENMQNINQIDFVKSLFYDCEPEFENEDILFPKKNFEDMSMSVFQNDFLEICCKENEQENNFLDDNQVEQLEVMHNPNDPQPDQQKITELHGHIQLIENMLCDTKEQLNQILQ